MPAAARSFRVEAIVLRHSDWGEADRLLVLYTREIGKVRAIAKGVRKMHSRKAGHLEPFTYARLLLARGRDLLIVTQAETAEAYLPIRDNLLLTGYAAYAVELVDRFSYEEGENRAIFQLLANTLERIATEPMPVLALRYYEIRLLDLLGFRPELFQCVNCREEILPRDQYFSLDQGGVLCPNCGGNFSGARPISMTVLKYLRHYQRSSYSEAMRAHPTQSELYEMESLLQGYLTQLLERKLNTPSFLREIRGHYPE